MHIRQYHWKQLGGCSEVFVNANINPQEAASQLPANLPMR